jgi:hypothetical protein
LKWFFNPKQFSKWRIEDGVSFLSFSLVLNKKMRIEYGASFLSFCLALNKKMRIECGVSFLSFSLALNKKKCVLNMEFPSLFLSLFLFGTEQEIRL